MNLWERKMAEWIGSDILASGFGLWEQQRGGYLGTLPK